MTAGSSRGKPAELDVRSGVCCCRPYLVTCDGAKRGSPVSSSHAISAGVIRSWMYMMSGSSETSSVRYACVVSHTNVLAAAAVAAGDDAVLLLVVVVVVRIGFDRNGRASPRSGSMEKSPTRDVRRRGAPRWGRCGRPRPSSRPPAQTPAVLARLVTDMAEELDRARAVVGKARASSMRPCCLYL
ncbi:hypothetical protein VTG60DRAFT_6718 [Thermothelomyces hinnuleus]